MGTDSERSVLLIAIRPGMLYGSWISTLVCPATEARSGSTFTETV